MNFKIVLVWFVLAFIIGAGSAFGVFVLLSKSTNQEVAEVKTVNLNDFAEQGGPLPEFDEEVDLIEEPVDPNAGIKKYTVKKGAQFPGTYAKSFIVADLDSGDIIAAKDKDLILPIASLSKLMTAIVAEETLSRDDKITISRSAVNTYGKQGRLSAGEVYSSQDIFYPLLLESSNDAAEAIAEYNGRDSFISDMNAKADSIGLSFTSFEDPSGLSANNVSTASELFRLTKYIYEFRRYILELTQLKKYQSDNKTWYNNSRFRNDKNYLGGKNGYTDEAGKTLVANFQLPLEGENGFRNISIVLLNSKDTTTDTRRILSFLLENVYYK